MGLTKEQVAKRLSYLWHMRETSDRYISEKMFKEKNLIYDCYGSDNEVSELSQKFYYETFGEDFMDIVKEGSLYKFE